MTIDRCPMPKSIVDSAFEEVERDLRAVGIDPNEPEVRRELDRLRARAEEAELVFECRSV